MSVNMKIKSMDCQVVWKYNFPQNTEDKCQICRRHIMAPSYEDINNNNIYLGSSNLNDSALNIENNTNVNINKNNVTRKQI